MAAIVIILNNATFYVKILFYQNSSDSSLNDKVKYMNVISYPRKLCTNKK